MTAQVARVGSAVLAGGALAVAIAACGGSGAHGTGTGVAAVSDTATTTAGVARTVSLPSIPVSAAEKFWQTQATQQDDLNQIPATPKGWTKADEGIGFVNGDPLASSATPLGDGDGLLEVRCSRTVTIYPTVHYTKNGPVTINTSTDGYPTSVSSPEATVKLKPFRCVSHEPAPTASSAALDPHWQGSLYIPNVGRFNAPAFGFALSAPAAVDGWFYYRK